MSTGQRVRDRREAATPRGGRRRAAGGAPSDSGGRPGDTGAPSPRAPRGDRPPKRAKSSWLTPKRAVGIGVSLVLVVGAVAFVVNTAVENEKIKPTPLSLNDMMRMAKDPFAPDPEADAIKAQAAQRARKASLKAARDDNKGLSPVFIPKQAPGGGGFQPQSFPAGSNPDPGSNKAVGQKMAAARGWGDQWGCLEKLWAKESGWNERAQNRYSGAYGIPQALPGSKMASKGADWQTNPATQIAWGLDYIAGRYGNPCGAWSHSMSSGWY